MYNATHPEHHFVTKDTNDISRLSYHPAISDPWTKQRRGVVGPWKEVVLSRTGQTRSGHGWGQDRDAQRLVEYNSNLRRERERERPGTFWFRNTPPNVALLSGYYTRSSG